MRPSPFLRRSRRKQRRQEDSGAVAVEFALLLPLLITFLVGVVTYGYMLAFQQSITEASAEGARAAAIAPPDKSATDRTTSATNAINRAMSNYGISCGNGGLTCTVTFAACSGDPSHNCASVKVSYNWSTNPRVPTIPLLPAPDKLEHKSVIEVS